jgi:predicted N-acyltransferase
MAGSLRYTAHRDIAGISAAVWNGVISRSGAPFFYRHEFLSSLQAHPLYHTREALYLVIEQQDSVAAVLPLYLVDQASPLTRQQDAGASGPAWVTHLPHWYDTWFPSTVPLDRVVGFLGSVLTELRIASVTFQNVGTPALLAALAAAGHEIAGQDARYTMRLTDYGSYDGWLQARGRSTRRNLRRAANRARSAGWRRCVVAGCCELERIVDLCRISTAKHANIDWLPRGSTIAFVRSLPADSVVVHQLSNASGIVAGAVGFLDHGTYHSWSGGVDSSMLPDGRVDANALLYLSELAYSYDRGLTLLEGGRRSAEVKTRLGMSETALHGVRVAAQ